MQEQELFLRKIVATHSSILAGEIPRTEEPGRLQSKGLQKNQTRLNNNKNWPLYPTVILNAVSIAIQNDSVLEITMLASGES